MAVVNLHQSIMVSEAGHYMYFVYTIRRCVDHKFTTQPCMMQLLCSLALSRLAGLRQHCHIWTATKAGNIHHVQNTVALLVDLRPRDHMETLKMRKRKGGSGKQGTNCDENGGVENARPE